MSEMHFFLLGESSNLVHSRLICLYVDACLGDVKTRHYFFKYNCVIFFYVSQTDAAGRFLQKKVLTYVHRKAISFNLNFIKSII